MNLIDDKGQLFGHVNVIDALVVLLVAAVVFGGVAFVFAPDSAPTSEPETVGRTAVLDLGSQPEYLARAIQVGDSYSPGENSRVTITGVYVALQRTSVPPDDYVPPDPERARVLLEVRLSGFYSNGSVIYEGEPLRLGRELVVQTDEYRVSGRLRDVGEGLQLAETLVVINASVSPETGEEVSEGDTYTVAGHDVATVESVSAYATENPDLYRLFLGLSIDTFVTERHPQFVSAEIAAGDLHTFRTDRYVITGHIHRVGASELVGTPATRTAVLKIDDLPPKIADNIQPGATETVRGQTVAEVVAVESRPADTEISSEGDKLILGPHPEKRDLTVTADLSVRETGSRVVFKGRTIKAGSIVHLGLENSTVRATIVEL